MLNILNPAPEPNPFLQMSLARYLLAQQAMLASHELLAAAMQYQEPMQAAKPTLVVMSEIDEVNEISNSSQQQEQALESEAVWDWDMLLDGEESK